MPRTGVVPADARVVQRCAASTSAQTTNSPGSRGHSSERPIRQDSSMHLSVNDMGGTGPRKTPGAAAKDSCQSTFQPQHPGCSSSPSLDPPITRETLSELDWDRLSNNLLLRHDLNFETNIQYRPNTYGARGLERSLQTAQYWDAVTVEVDISLANKRRKCSYHSQRCLRTPPPSSKPLRSCHKILLRLPRMFRAIRETLKTLVPEKEWQAIDSRLDVELLVQQMQYGACDFTSLGDCLANLLRRFCSPDRDHLFDDLTAGIRQGVIQADAQLIVTSLRCAFSILEIMRLDFANHQIRYLRLSTVNSTVFFEQQDFLRRIADGWDPTEAQTWFTNEQQARGLSSRSCTFTAAITDLIVQTAESLPPTFTLDYIRLRTLQADFQSLKSRAACLQTLKAMLKSLGWNGAIPQCSYDDFFARISVLISDEALKPDQSETIGDVTLEVVREAYKLCEISKLPTAEDLDFAENHLRDSWEGKNRVFAEVKSSLCEQLHNLVEEEVEAIGNLTPVQIINRYAPEGSELVTEQVVLLRMAQKIAHIAVLHWRVWASIVYKQAVGHRFQEGSVSQVRSSFSSPNTTRPSSDSERNTRRGSAAVDM